MTRDVVIVDDACSLEKAVLLMREKNIGSVVVRSQDGSFGIFTERDLLNKVALNRQGNELASPVLRDLMTKDIKVISANESYLEAIKLMRERQIRHMPVVDDGKIVGLVSFRDLMSHHEKRLESLNLELADKTKELTQKTAKLNTIMHLSRQLISNMETQEILAHITKVGRELLHADTASVILLKEEAGEFMVIASEFSGAQIRSDLIHPSLDANHSITGWVIKNRQPLLLYGKADDDPRFRNIQWKEGIKCSINVPLLYKNSVKGTLNFNITESDHIFTEEDLATAIILANHVSVAVENSGLFRDLQDSLIEYLKIANERIRAKNEELRITQEKMNQELKTVAVVQQALLPKSLPKNSRVDMAAVYAAAGVVGGDYYDCIEMKDSRLGIVIADVTGHSLPSAFVMTMIKILLFYLNHQGISIIESISILNNMLVRHVPISTFASLAYGVLDLEKMTFEHINAGHEPILRINAVTQKKEFFFADSLLLGVEAETEFVVNKITLEKGDKLVFYTDGLTDAMNKDRESFGRKRLAEIVNNHVQKSSKEIIDAVIQELNLFCEGQTRADDLTMLVLSL